MPHELFILSQISVFKQIRFVTSFFFVFQIGALCGSFFSGQSVSKIGRKKTLLILGGPFTIGWAAIAVAQNIYMIYAGRFLTGLLTVSSFIVL